jgi:hypothetical protein
MFKMKYKLSQICLAGFISTILSCPGLTGQYTPSGHRTPGLGEIPVTGPGNYGIPGATYVLVNDISSPRSAVFLGKDVTLDLNGYKITFADGNYGHVTNYGFEEGLKGWDITKAPGARIMDTEKTHAFIGKKLMSLKAGDELISDFVYLPVGGRSYCAICGVTGSYYNDMGGDLSKDMRVSVYVDDEEGREIRCTTRYSDSTSVSCPVINRSTRLGGGFVFAHLSNLPAGRYRIRVKAENDCLVDEIDIRPSMDAGVCIVGRTHPMGHYDHLYDRSHSAFFDYTADISEGKPVAGIPVVRGSGTVTIKNGTIINGTKGFLSWGVQSTAASTRIILDNVEISSSGINCIAVDVEQATISRCSFKVDNPFIINRHGAEFYAVDLRGGQASEVSFSSFLGGQGCLSFKGDFSKVHHNHFINRQTVTNHYSIMAMGDSSLIFSNHIEPEIGSGIEIYVHRGIEIFNNEFHISAAPPSCEYNEHLSTNGIRIADYGAKRGAVNGCYGNRIYNNRFFISGKKYKEYPDYIPMASAFFYSASGGDNEVFGNQIYIDQKDPDTDAEAFAFYIGNSNGGLIYNNTIISNVSPVWVGSSYGRAENTILKGNIIARSPGTTNSFKPVRMGSKEQPDYVALGTRFMSNVFKEIEFGADETDQKHKYSVFWTLRVNLQDRSGKPLGNNEIVISDRNGKEVFRQNTDSNGNLEAELAEFIKEGDLITYFSPYRITSGKKKMDVELTKNTEMEFIK